MNLYFVKLEDKPNGMSFNDFVVLATSKNVAENYMVTKFNRNPIRERTRLVPNGHYLVAETFINSEV